MLALQRGATRASRSFPARALPSSTRHYHQNIIDHYESPRNVGTLDKSDPSVGSGLVGAPACGDVMRLQMRIGEDGRVEEAVFKVATPAAPASPAPRWVLHFSAAVSHTHLTLPTKA